MQDFQNIIGNNLLLTRIRSAVEQGALSHAYSISGSEGSGRYTFAKTLAAAMVCEGKALRPCGVCRHCRKAEGGIHPDIIVMSREEDRREIYVDQIRTLVRDAPILPNEAEKKVYLIKNAESMNLSAQNALLKLLEEPPSHLSIILLCRSSNDLLPTVRSRCVSLSMSPVDTAQAARYLKVQFPELSDQAILDAAELSGGLIGQAMDYLSSGAGTAASLAGEFVRLLKAKDRLSCLSFSIKLEKLDREMLASFLRQTKAVLIKLMEEPASLDPLPIIPTLSLLERAETFMDFNVGTAHIAGLIAVQAIL